jgi:hypothetical protein
VLPGAAAVLGVVVSSSAALDATYEHVEGGGGGGGGAGGGAGAGALRPLLSHGPFLTVLPLLLAGVLPCAGPGQLQAFVEAALPQLAAAVPAPAVVEAPMVRVP